MSEILHVVALLCMISGFREFDHGMAILASGRRIFFGLFDIALGLYLFGFAIWLAFFFDGGAT